MVDAAVEAAAAQEAGHPTRTTMMMMMTMLRLVEVDADMAMDLTERARTNTDLTDTDLTDTAQLAMDLTERARTNTDLTDTARTDMDKAREVIVATRASMANTDPKVILTLVDHPNLVIRNTMKESGEMLNSKMIRY
jgi:hypothetical protein